MSENVQTPAGEENAVEPRVTNTNRRHTNRNSNHQNRPVNVQSNTPRDYAGTVPKIGGILALCSENLNNKVNYDVFYEKLGVYIMNEFKNGEHIVQVVKDPSADVLSFTMRISNQMI